jgi:hypothetical protein
LINHLYHLKNITFILIFLYTNCSFIAAPLHAQSRHGKPLDENAIKSITSSKDILYNGIDNRLRLDQKVFYGFDTLLLHSNNGSILIDTLNTYLCYPEKVGSLWLTVYSILNNDTAMLGFKYFLVENIPEPLLTLNNRPIKTPITLPKSTLISCDSLGVFFSEDLKGSENWMTITEFSLGYSYGGYYVSHNNPSNKLSKSTKDIISKLGPEKELSIRPVVRSEGKVMKQLPIYRITIY